MAQFMMIMKGVGSRAGGDWGSYVAKLRQSKHFRGGSSLANGFAFAEKVRSEGVTVSGYMHFEAETIDEVIALLAGNPLYEAGGAIEILEAVRD